MEGLMNTVKRLLVSAHIFLILLAIGVLLVTSCSGASNTTSTTKSSPSSTSTTSAVTTTSPKPISTISASAPPTGVLKVAMPSFEEETFLPWTGNGGRKFFIDTIFEYLIYIDPISSLPVPGLAKTWSGSTDGKTWTVNLREGIQFQANWGELTSEDVKYTFEREMEPSSKAPHAGNFRDMGLTVSAPDKYTVVFNLTKPDPIFWTRLANSAFNYPVCKKYVQQVGDQEADARPIGTGAYTLVEQKRGVSIKVTAVPKAENHWRFTPAYKDIVFNLVPEESTRVAMLLTGETNMAPIAIDSVENAKAHNFNIFTRKDAWGARILMGGLLQTDPKRYNSNAPWAKKEVRQALNYAVDKESIVRNILKGMARTNYEPHMFSDIDTPVYPYNVNKAKELLASAGYPNGFPVSLYSAPRNPGAQLPDIGLAVATNWEAVGIKVKIVPTDNATILSAWSGGKANEMFWTHANGPAISLDDTGMLTAGYVAASAYSSFTTPELDKMGAEAMAEPNATKRAALMANICKYLTDQADFIFLASAQDAYAADKTIGNWPAIKYFVTNFDQVTKAK
jgi:peptide/nickel transport system substrate-binding protein